MKVWLVDFAYAAFQANKHFKLDYVKLLDRLRRAYGKGLGCTVFNSESADLSPGLDRLYNLLHRHGAEVRLHPMQHGRQRRVDVDIGCHLVYYACGGARQLILTTGDQDLIPAVEMVRSRYNTKVTLLTFPGKGHVSGDLIAACNEHITFDRELDGIY